MAKNFVVFHPKWLGPDTVRFHVGLKLIWQRLINAERKTRHGKAEKETLFARIVARSFPGGIEDRKINFVLLRVGMHTIQKNELIESVKNAGKNS